MTGNNNPFPTELVWRHFHLSLSSQNPKPQQRNEEPSQGVQFLCQERFHWSTSLILRTLPPIVSWGPPRCGLIASA